MLRELDEMFLEGNQEIVMDLSLVSLTIRKDPKQKQTVMKMIELYEVDLPSLTT